MWLMESYDPAFKERDGGLTDVDWGIKTIADEFKGKERYIVKVNLKSKVWARKGLIGIDERVFWPVECSKAEGLPDFNRIERFSTVNAIPSLSLGFDSGALSNLSSAQPDVPPSSTSQKTALGSSRDGSRPSTERCIRRAWTIWRADHKWVDKDGPEISKPERNGPCVKMVESTKDLAEFFGVAGSWLARVMKANATTEYPVLGLQPVSTEIQHSGELMWLMKSYSPTSNQQVKTLNPDDLMITQIAEDFKRGTVAFCWRWMSSDRPAGD